MVIRQSYVVDAVLSASSLNRIVSPWYRQPFLIFPGVRASVFGLYRYVTRTNVSFFDPSPNDQRTENSCA